jgi:hypothetical protein
MYPDPYPCGFLFFSLEDVTMSERYNPDKGEWVTVQGGRSPSPEPVYDRSGRRSNTRDLRLRERLQKERLSLVEKMMTLQPANSALGQIKFQTTKKSTKLFVPIKEYPGYPFIGLILGPRGNTQKKLERETGTKVVIRGKGSVKDGKKGKSEDPSEDEDLHVLITGDTQEQVCAAPSAARGSAARSHPPRAARARRQPQETHLPWQGIRCRAMARRGRGDAEARLAGGATRRWTPRPR